MSDAIKPKPVIAQPVTSGSHHHFFGYYDKSCWDAGDRWILGQETDFMDRPPTERDRAVIGRIDTRNGNAWEALAETHAWNWQQGCMLQWLNGGPEIIFNDLQDGRFISRILNTETGKERSLDHPVYTVNRAGTHAVSLSFSRLQHQRPGYGYPGVPDPWEMVAEPVDDGVRVLDLRTGKSKLILSTAAVANFGRKPEFDGKIHRFNHAQFGADDNRFAVLHRYKPPGDKGVGQTRLLTMDIDGGDLCCLSDHGIVSHYDWRGGDAILAWANRHGIGERYFLFHDRSDEVEVVGEDVFTSDGHCSFSPDQAWMLTDTYPDDTNHRTLIIYHLASGRRVDIGRFFSPPVKWQIRCDLHPRWSRDGRQICIDSVHEGARQIYVLDVGKIVGSAPSRGFHRAGASLESAALHSESLVH